MEKKTSNLTTDLQNVKKSKGRSRNASVKSSQLMRLFEDHLKDHFWVEESVSSMDRNMNKLK